MLNASPAPTVSNTADATASTDIVAVLVATAPCAPVLAIRLAPGEPATHLGRRGAQSCSAGLATSISFSST